MDQVQLDVAPPQGQHLADAGTGRLCTLWSGSTLAIYVQTVWAGTIREGQGYDQRWVSVHDWGHERLSRLLSWPCSLRSSASADAATSTAEPSTWRSSSSSSRVGELGGENPRAVALHNPRGDATLALAVWPPFRSTPHTLTTATVLTRASG